MAEPLEETELAEVQRLTASVWGQPVISKHATTACKEQQSLDSDSVMAMAVAVVNR